MHCQPSVDLHELKKIKRLTKAKKDGKLKIVGYKCHLCDFQHHYDRDSVKNHVKSQHLNIGFKCNKCNFVATTIGRLVYHKRIHREYLYCPECDYKSSGKDKIQRHINAVHKLVRFQCDLCDKSYKDEDSMKAHRKIHTNEAKSCCGKLYDPKSFRSHQRQKHSDKVLDCKFCEFKTTVINTLKVHQKKHDTTKWKNCSMCNYSAFNQSGLNTHLESKHGDKDYQCDKYVISSGQRGVLKTQK